MSYDICAMDLPRGISSVDRLPEGFEPQPLGARADLVARIGEVVADADFSDPAWGLIERHTFVIEVNMGRDDPVESITFHVRGTGDEALALVARVLEHLDLRAVDVQSGDLFAAPSAGQSFKAWQEFRDDALGGHS
jgi:hypothetical protein